MGLKFHLNLDTVLYCTSVILYALNKIVQILRTTEKDDNE